MEVLDGELAPTSETSLRYVSRSMKRKRVSKAIVHQPGAQLYERFVETIKERIRTAQIKAALAAGTRSDFCLLSSMA